MFRKWKPSKKAIKEFIEKMDEIEEYCSKHNISASSSNDSYYFVHNGVKYRISNHAVENSVSRYGEHYHGDSEEYRKKTFCIHAGKTRLIEIHQAIINGKKVNHKGEVIHA